MTTERWQEVKELFASTIACAPDERSSFLASSCQGDAELHREAERLLAAHEQSNDFIETPAFQTAPELLLDDPDVLIGQHLGSYRVDAVLGAGGMGVVYRAEDERLGRKVALKLLPPPLVTDEIWWERLRREARTASALNHPNIVTIHEIGEAGSTHYIATEFIEGTTLRERMTRGPLAPDEVVEIAAQVASALCVAHRAGIVHRDVKPENIMLRPDGYVKVLDFGIAKLTEQDSIGPTLAGGETTTNPGMIPGTTRYMSPEQARGQLTDARSDLWSLGVVVYEMLTGRPPFDGARAADVLAAVVLNEPQPLEQAAGMVSPGLQRIVQKALQKAPRDRYQTAEEMLSDLRTLTRENNVHAAVAARESIRHKRSAQRIGVAAVAALFFLALVFYGWREGRNREHGAAAPNDKSIAVLPFEDLTWEAGDSFLADGIHDDLVTSLARIKDLKVIGRGSVVGYRGEMTAEQLREIGAALGVAHLLQGSVRRADNRVVVNVALIDARNAAQKWAQRYERTFDDALSLQGDLAVEIARELQATLTLAEATVAAAKPTQNAEAYLLYLRGREAEIAAAYEQVQPAVQLYQKAVDLDPNFALARARLSLCASRLHYSDAPGGDWKAKARAEADEALRIHPRLGEARLALAHCHLWGESAYHQALAELAKAAELLPNSPEVPLTAAFIYKRQNRYRDRMAALHRAEALDPQNRRVFQYLTTTHRWLRQWSEAIETFEKFAAVQPDEPTLAWRCSRFDDEFRLTGDINVLKKAIAKETELGTAAANSAWLTMARYEVAMFERNYTQAAQQLPPAFPATRDAHSLLFIGHSRAFHEALLAVVSNADAHARRQALERATAETEHRLSSAEATSGLDQPAADLAVLYAFLGRKEDAIRQGQEALEIASEGSSERHDLMAALALVYAQTGEPEKAIALIEHLLTVPTDLQRGAVYNMTLTDLKWRWVWDPLRTHPRFQKLLAGPEPKTVY